MPEKPCTVTDMRKLAGALLPLWLWTVACTSDPEPRTATRTDSAISGIPILPVKKTPVASVVLPVEAVQKAPPVLCATEPALPGDTAESLGPALNALHAWQKEQHLLELDFASGRAFRQAQADGVRKYLKTATGGDRKRAERLAFIMLGLAARTRDEGGSRWDCTTRMFQVSAQARRLAGSRGISYTGWNSHTKQVETVSGEASYAGETVSSAVLLLMDVGHYHNPKLANRNMEWKTEMLAAGDVLKPAYYDRIAPGEVFFYPDIARGHFGLVLFVHRKFLVMVEGFFKGLPTVIHLFPRTADVPGICIARELAKWRGFDELGVISGDGDAVSWARNVSLMALVNNGRLRVGEHR